MEHKTSEHSDSQREVPESPQAHASVSPSISKDPAESVSRESLGSSSSSVAGMGQQRAASPSSSASPLHQPLMPEGVTASSASQVNKECLAGVSPSESASAKSMPAASSCTGVMQGGASVSSTPSASSSAVHDGGASTSASSTPYAQTGVSSSYQAPAQSCGTSPTPQQMAYVQSVTSSAQAQQPIVLQLPMHKPSRAPWVLLGIALLIILVMVGSCAAIPFSLMHEISSLEESSLEDFASSYPAATHSHSVAVIHWDDSISARQGVNPEQVRDQLAAAEHDDKVDAILIRCNCPGGTVAASEEISTYIAQCSKPVVFSVSDLCASGAYMSASQADAIVAMPTSEVGSIGVIMSHTDLTGLLEKLGIKIDPIKSDNSKDAGAYYREMTPEERQKFEETIHDYHTKFINIVAKGRSLPVDKVRALATGELYPGDKALEMGLIDKLGTFDDALQVVAQLTNNNYEDLTLLDYDPKPSFGSMLGIPGVMKSRSPLEELLGIEQQNMDEHPHPSAR